MSNATLGTATLATKGLVKISRKDFVDMVSDGKGASFISMLTRTAPKFRKTGCAFKKIERVVEHNGVIGAKFANIVNNQFEREIKTLVAEGTIPAKMGESIMAEHDYVPGPLVWGTHYNQFFITHKGKFYLKYRPVKSGDSLWLADGSPVEKSDVESYLYAPQAQGDTASTMLYRTFGVDNIVEITYGGTESKPGTRYELVD